MAAYVIADIEVLDPERYEDYKQLSGKALAAHGGSFVVRGGETTVLEGGWQPGRLVVLEFKDAEQARRWYDSAEYRPALKLRQETARTRMILVEGASRARAPHT